MKTTALSVNLTPDIYGKLHTEGAERTFFQSSCGTFSRLQISGHKIGVQFLKHEVYMIFSPFFHI